jgi:DNA replication protein DnaC
MENLGDILKRLATTRNVSNGDPPPDGWDEPEGRAEQCEVCGGRGWFTPNVSAGHPEFGQVITCQCQHARLEEERSARLLKYSNLGHLTRFTFETLNPRGQSEDPENQRLFNQAYQAAVEYAENPSGWLVFCGPNGSGKTHLAAAIANRCIARGFPSFFVYVPDLLDHLRSSFGPASEVSYSDLFEQVKNTPLLILDGLANQRTTPWAEEKLQQIVNHRSSGQLPTVVTTASELAELDPYVLSRLEARETSRICEVQVRRQGAVPRLGRIEPEMLRRMTFATFDVRGNNPGANQQASLEAAFQAAKNFSSDPHGWITFFGVTGVGKTHLAVAIAAEQASQGNPVFFAFVPELLDYLRYTFSPESRVTYDHVFDEIKNTPLLVLDDLGREHSSPWAEEKLYQIIVHRHNARLPTVITSMLGFTDQTGPISSRVRDPYVGQLVRIDAPDYRIKEKGGQGRRGSTRRKGAAR